MCFASSQSFHEDGVVIPSLSPSLSAFSRLYLRPINVLTLPFAVCVSWWVSELILHWRCSGNLHSVSLSQHAPGDWKASDRQESHQSHQIEPEHCVWKEATHPLHTHTHTHTPIYFSALYVVNWLRDLEPTSDRNSPLLSTVSTSSLKLLIQLPVNASLSFFRKTRRIWTLVHRCYVEIYSAPFHFLL